MKKIVVSFGVTLVTIMGVMVATKSQSQKPETSATVIPHAIIRASDVKWEDAPPGVPSGAKMAVLDGDPSKEGSFTVRLKFDTKAMHKKTPGDFAVLPAGMAHFVWSRGESVTQIQSEGPFRINYVNRADDPRNANK